MIDALSNSLYDYINDNVYKYLNREKGRKIRKTIVTSLEEQLYKTPLTKESIGIILRSFHITAPFIFITLLLVSKFKIVCDIILFILLLIPCLFVLLDGCLLSSLETRVTGDTFNVIDPVLEWSGMDKTTKNRMKINYFACFYYFIIGAIIYIYRFYGIKDKRFINIPLI